MQKWLTRLLNHPRLLPQPIRMARGGESLIRILSEYQAMETIRPEALRTRQLQLLADLLAHHAETSPHFNKRLATSKLSHRKLAKPGALSSLPVMTRQVLIAAGESLFSKNVPPSHGPVRGARTSGSTGEVVQVRRTELGRLHNRAAMMREHLWHDRDVSTRSAAVRANVSPEDRKSWGRPYDSVFDCGPLQIRSSSEAVSNLADWLLAWKPSHLVVYPSVLKGLIDEFETGDQSPAPFHSVRTFAEMVSPELRERTREILACPVSDVYSSEEFGVLAIQCPEAGNYHVTESVLLEIVGENGAPCGEGENGKVIISDLLNHATPLIRYDIRDRALRGPDRCPCGRSSPTVTRFLGRERNLVVLPDGSKHWPLVGFRKFLEILPVLQFQLVQENLKTVTANLHTRHPAPEKHEEELAAIIQNALGHPFAIRFEWSPSPLPKGPNDKFEEFICRVT